MGGGGCASDGNLEDAEVASSYIARGTDGESEEREREQYRLRVVLLLSSSCERERDRLRERKSESMKETLVYVALFPSSSRV